jgi:ubiquinone/menaquinone biosynthesis C-methylase UbiE
MIGGAVSRIWNATRLVHPDEDSSEDTLAFIESRSLEYPSQLEDEFVRRALSLGVESGMILDVGTRAGLIPLKMLWQNENLYAIGIDRSGPIVERARETAAAWGLENRAFFQVGDARKMRLKDEYFDMVVSDSTLHRFDDVVAVLEEIHRVLKPKGALLIRDYCRPNRWQMSRRIREHAARFGNAMLPQVEAAIRASYTRPELQQALNQSGLPGIQMVEAGDAYVMLERRGATDPGSWILTREQYL